MFVGMFEVESFCGCCNVITCSKVIAIFSLIGGTNQFIMSLILKNISYSPIDLSSIINLCVSFFGLPYQNILHSLPLPYYILYWSFIFMDIIWIIFAGLMFCGTSKKKPGLMVPFIVLVGLMNVIQTFTWARFDVILVLFHGSVNAFGYYLLFIIWSAYQKIKEELSNPATTRLSRVNSIITTANEIVRLRTEQNRRPNQGYSNSLGLNPAISTVTRPSNGNTLIQRQISLPSYEMTISRGATALPAQEETPPPKYDEINFKTINPQVYLDAINEQNKEN